MKDKKYIYLIMAIVMVISPLAGCTSETSQEDDYPSRSINGYIAWAAGGATDNVMRTIVPLAEKELGETIILSNKTGGTGSIATQYVYTKPADGYTMLFNAENPPLYKLLNLGEIDYDNFIPVVVLAKNIGILVVPADSPYDTYEEFIEGCKTNPGKINVAATGVGGLPLNSMSLLKSKEGIEFNFVTFDGDGTLQPALIGYQVDVSVVGQAAAVQYVKSGDLKALCVFSNEPVENLPGVPALGELNPDFQPVLESWGPFYGAFVKEGTDGMIVEKLSNSFKTAAEDEVFVKFCDNLGLQPLGYTGDKAVEFIKNWQAMTCWALYDAGATEISPEEIGIPRP